MRSEVPTLLGASVWEDVCIHQVWLVLEQNLRWARPHHYLEEVSICVPLFLDIISAFSVSHSIQNACMSTRWKKSGAKIELERTKNRQVLWGQNLQITKTMRRQSIEWEIIFAKDTSIKGLLPNTFKEYFKLNNKKTTNLIKNEPKALTHLTKEYIQMTSIWKDDPHHRHQGSAN